MGLGSQQPGRESYLGKWELWMDGAQRAEREAIAQESKLWTDLFQLLIIVSGQMGREREKGGHGATLGP